MNLNKLDFIFKERKVQNRVLAKYFGKTEYTISKWRNNKRQPSLDEFYEIAKLLRIDIRDLIEPTAWKNEHSETYERFAKKVKE